MNHYSCVCVCIYIYLNLTWRHIVQKHVCATQLNASRKVCLRDTKQKTSRKWPLRDSTLRDANLRRAKCCKFLALYQVSFTAFSVDFA